MNLLLDNKEKGFQVAPTLQSCTKGIWIWGNTKNSQNIFNNNCKIIFIDSEGMSSTDKSTKTYDSRIFALIVLISSLFLYNTYSNIDENGINELSLAAHLSNSIKVNTNIDKDELLTLLSPSFIWIIRDFSLEKIHPKTGEEISSKEYLELCLENKNNKIGKDNNIIRQNIMKYFPERDCITLVRPLDNDEDIKNLKNYNFNDLKPEFKMEFKKLKDKVYKEAMPKKYNGKKLNGPDLARLIIEFVNVINSGKIPNINNAWDNVIEKDINDYYNKSWNYYKNNVDKLIIDNDNVFDNDELYYKLKSFEKNALYIYDEYLFHNADTLNHREYKKLYEEKRNELIKQIVNNISKYNNHNLNCSNAYNNNLINECYKNFYDNIDNNTYNYNNKEQLCNDYINFCKDFNEKSKGPTKENIFIDFIYKKEKNLLEYIEKMMSKDGDNNMKKLDGEFKNFQTEIEIINKKNRIGEEQEKINNNKIQLLESENMKLIEEVDDLHNTIIQKKRQMEKIKAIYRTKKRNRLKREESKKKMEDERQKKLLESEKTNKEVHCCCSLF